MTKKIPTNTPFGKAITKTWYNETIDAIDFVKSYRKPVQPQKDPPIWLAYSGTQFDVYQHVQILEAKADTPPNVTDVTRTVTIQPATVEGHIAILQSPVAANTYAPIQLHGQTWAKVTITNASHTHARLDTSNPTGPLVSGYAGYPLLSNYGTGIELIYLTSPTEAHVYKSPEGTGVPPREGLEPGQADCELWLLDRVSGQLTQTSLTHKVWNISKGGIQPSTEENPEFFDAHPDKYGTIWAHGRSECPAVYGFSDNEISAYASGTVKVCAGETATVEGTNGTPDAIPANCPVIGIPNVCDGTCKYVFIPVKDWDLSCLHNRPVVTSLQSSGQYFLVEYSLFQVGREGCVQTLCLGPTFIVQEPIPCCYPCTEECITFILPKPPEDTVYIGFNGDNTAVNGGTKIGQARRTLPVPVGEVQDVDLYVTCGYASNVADYWVPSTNCNDLLGIGNVAQILYCTEAVCPGGDCDSDAHDSLISAGLIKVGETDEACIYAGCTTCPTDTLIPSLQGIPGTVRVGNPCKFFPDASFTNLPDCCTCTPPSETCWVMAIDKDPPALWYYLHTSKITAPYINPASGCGTPTYYGYLAEGSLTGPTGFHGAIWALCCEVPAGGTPPGPGWSNRLPPTQPYILIPEAALPSCNNSYCDDLSIPGWTLIGESSYICIFATCSETQPDTGSLPTPFQVNPCEYYAGSGVTLDLTALATVTCCDCTPTSNCYVAVIPGTGCTTNAELEADGWSYLGTATEGCVWGKCSDTVPSITYDYQIGNPCVLYPSAPITQSTLDTAGLTCCMCEVANCDDCADSTLTTGDTLILEVGTVTNNSHPDANCTGNDCADAGGTRTLIPINGSWEENISTVCGIGPVWTVTCIDAGGRTYEASCQLASGSWVGTCPEDFDPETGWVTLTNTDPVGSDSCIIDRDIILKLPV